MKLIYWILIIIVGALFPPIFMVVVPIIILDSSWWWLWSVLIIEGILGLVLGAIFLIMKLRKKPLPKIKLDIKSAKAKAINEFLYDNDDPDNFKVDKKARLVRIGEKGAEKTPILHLEGYGTETQTRRHAIINLNNPKQEITKLKDPMPEEVEEAIRLIAEHPPEQEIKEETTTGYDPKTGLPIVRTRTSRPSSIERKEAEEKKEAEESNIL